MPLTILASAKVFCEVGVFDVGLVGGGVGGIHEEVEEVGADEGVVDADGRVEGGGGIVAVEVGGGCSWAGCDDCVRYSGRM